MCQNFQQRLVEGDLEDAVTGSTNAKRSVKLFSTGRKVRDMQEIVSTLCV